MNWQTLLAVLAILALVGCAGATAGPNSSYAPYHDQGRGLRSGGESGADG